MEDKDVGIGGIWPRRFWEYGPLVLDGEKSLAFVEDVDLALSEQEFDALYLLVKEKGTPLSMETLYKAIWEPPEEADERAAARLGMGSLTRKLNSAGHGVIWIEDIPERGFALRLRGRAST